MNWRFWQRKSGDNTGQTTGQSEQMELPQEVREYYEATQRSSKGRSWLFGLATLVATMLIAGVLFMGGQFVYRQFQNDDSTPVAVDENVNQEPIEEVPAEEESNDEPADNSDNSSDDETTTLPGDEEVEVDETEDESEENRSDNDTTPTTGSSNIPNTGPGNLLAVFTSTSLISAAAYHLFNKRLR